MMRCFKIYIIKMIILLAAFTCFSNCSQQSLSRSIILKSQIIYLQQSTCRYIKDLDIYVISIPGRPGVIVAASNCELLTGEEIRFAIDLFYWGFKKKFGDHKDEVKSGLANIIIRLDKSPKKVRNLYDTKGTYLEESFVNGLFISPNIIWIHVTHGTPIADTALIHELMHYALLLSTGDADADHEGKKYGQWNNEHTRLINDLTDQLGGLLSP